MAHLEKQFLDNCDPTIKPVLYHRYINDTFCLFNDRHAALNFLNYINSIHPNIKFTIEEESIKISIHRVGKNYVLYLSCISVYLFDQRNRETRKDKTYYYTNTVYGRKISTLN